MEHLVRDLFFQENKMIHNSVIMSIVLINLIISGLSIHIESRNDADCCGRN